MIVALKSCSLIVVLLCRMTRRRGRQIHLKAIFDISMCHPKVPYHYTFIMTTSRKKSQKFTQTNSKRPSKVKEAGSCLTERRANRVIPTSFFILMLCGRDIQVSHYISKAITADHFFEILAGTFKRYFENAWCAKLEAYIKRDGWQYIV